ncbi:MAG: glycosyltransferase family 1 protein, partial [Chthoniobacterales bacterium]|nr:glycosyltransferase family 1 protein [Chthoniobacterales bacterium]
MQEITRAFLKSGAQVDLFAARPEGEPPADFATVKVHPLPDVGKGEVAAREKRCLHSNEELRTALEREGPFALLYERYSLWSFAGIEYARDRGTPSILEVNAPLIEEQAEHRVLVDRAAAERVA